VVPPSPLGVVVPFHSRSDLLAGCLASVAGWPVWVVDDSPTGLPPDTLPAGATLLRSTGEEGFARACNRGLAAVEAAGHPWALLLNDDARPQGDCLDRLLSLARTRRRLGAAGPVLVDPRGRVESAGIRVGSHSARIRQRRRVPAQRRRVDALSGACLLLASHRRLDPAYRFGFEDIALCQSLIGQGWEVLLEPRARCEHHGGASLSRRSRAATRYALAGHLRLLGPHRWQRPLALGWAIAQVIRERGPAERLLGLWEGWRDSDGF
jgi:GT2 family glycosyltransferase